MIFYFTSTGNSLYVAKQLNDATLISIPQALKQDTLEYNDEVIGIVCPDYAGEIPHIVRRFLEKAKLQAEYIYIIITYGKFHSISPRWAKEYAQTQGIHVNYCNKVLMVDNWLPNFDMFEEMAIDKQIPDQIKTIQEDIQNRKEFLVEDAERGQELHDLVQQRNIDDPRWTNGSALLCNTEKCIGCGICTKVCPVGRNILVDGKRQESKSTCEFCLGCIHACPKNAFYLEIPEKNSNARYLNPNISIKEIMNANNQGD